MIIDETPRSRTLGTGQMDIHTDFSRETVFYILSPFTGVSVALFNPVKARAVNIIRTIILTPLLRKLNLICQTVVLSSL